MRHLLGICQELTLEAQTYFAKCDTYLTKQRLLDPYLARAPAKWAIIPNTTTNIAQQSYTDNDKFECHFMFES